MMARYHPVIAVAATVAVFGLGQVSAQAKARIETSEPAVSQTTRAQLEGVLAQWPEKGRDAVRRMIVRCGQPQQVSETAIIWTVTDGETRCNPAAAGIPPEDGGAAYNVGRADGTN